MGIIEDGPKEKQGIIMEYCEHGNLKDFNRNYMMKCNCWARKVKMILEIAQGMNFLHKLDPPIAHADLKLENVFVGDGFVIKVNL